MKHIAVVCVIMLLSATSDSFGGWVIEGMRKDAEERLRLAQRRAAETRTDNDLAEIDSRYLPTYQDMLQIMQNFRPMSQEQINAYCGWGMYQNNWEQNSQQLSQMQQQAMLIVAEMQTIQMQINQQGMWLAQNNPQTLQVLIERYNQLYGILCQLQTQYLENH